MAELSERTRSALEDAVRTLRPAARIRAIKILGADSSAEASADVTAKAAGYGGPVLITLAGVDGVEERLVFRQALANEFGHDRRADRAAAMLLDYDTFGALPRHVEALDVGARLSGGTLLSLREAGEFYLISSYADGTPYAEDLRRVARTGVATENDVQRAEALARYLADLHRPIDSPVAYARATRDLFGDGEGIFGIVDAFPPDTPGAPPSRLAEIEHRCIDWRWRLKSEAGRLARGHGDFHPFNVVFREGVDFSVLDTSRGSLGDPADDVTCMAINYPFFALQYPASWQRGLGPLWDRFWQVYLERTGDRGVLETAPPYFTWRCLVVTCPRWYPNLARPARDAMLGLAERALAAGRLDPVWVPELFR